MITYDEYLIKRSKISDAERLLKLGKISPEEFTKQYVGIPSEPLPENFEEIAKDICDNYREPFGFSDGGHLSTINWTIFPDEPDYVYFVFDTIFRGEADEDYIVVQFPVKIFNDETEKTKFIIHARVEYDNKKKAEERKQRRGMQNMKYGSDFYKELRGESDLRIEQSNWKNLRKKYLPEEFDWIVEAFVKRGFIEKEHKQDCINYLKIDLL